MNWTCLAIKWRNVFSWLPVRMQTDGTKSKFEGKARTAFTNQCQLRPMLFLWEDGNKLKSISLNGLRCHIRYFKIKVKCRIVEYQSISVHFLHNLIVYLIEMKSYCKKKATVDLIPSNPKNILKSKSQKQTPSVKMPFEAKIY